jgi:hypothetical protein
MSDILINCMGFRRCKESELEWEQALDSVEHEKFFQRLLGTRGLLNDCLHRSIDSWLARVGWALPMGQLGAGVVQGATIAEAQNCCRMIAKIGKILKKKAESREHKFPETKSLKLERLIYSL